MFMPKLNIDGNAFEGPNKLGKDKLPAEPAVAVIAVEAGEGIIILSVLESDNIARAVTESKWIDCWKKNAGEGKEGWKRDIDVYIQLNSNKLDREMIRERIRNKRRETIRCEDFKLPDFE